MTQQGSQTSQPLTEFERVFCEEYIIDFNGAQAFLRARAKVMPKRKAVKNTTAKVKASRLLTSDNLQIFLQRLIRSQAEARAKAEANAGQTLTRDQIIDHLKAIALSDISDYVEWHKTVSGEDNIEGTTLVLKSLDEMTNTWAISKLTSSHGKYGPSFRIELHDKLTALQLMMKHLGMIDDLDRAVQILERYGFKCTETEYGYRMVDTLKQMDADRQQRYMDEGMDGPFGPSGLN